MSDNYKQLYESMCEANTALQNKILLLQERVKLLTAEKEQWVKEKMVQQRTIQSTLNSVNERMNSILEENRRLKYGN